MGQLFFFIKDVNQMVGKNKIKILSVWLQRGFWGVLSYRIDRSLYLLIPSIYKYIRVPLTPIFILLEIYSNIEIDYHADIKGGMKILHPSAGVFIGKSVIVGENFTITGGNFIGSKRKVKLGEFYIGNNCNFGANATIIGPVILGDNIKIGASACVVKDCIKNNTVLAGVPAIPLKT
jgi:serine acetyltransferase